VVALAAVLLGCSGGLSSSSPTPSGPLLTGPPASYLLQLDDLPLPGFTVATAAASVTAAELAAADQGRADGLRSAHLAAAARVRYFRPVADFATSNGPVDVISTVERFTTVAGASKGFTVEAAYQDSLPGAIPLSTGPLGDQGHGVLTTADSNGVPVARTVLVWRVANLVSILEVHERLGGSPLAHALNVARPQLVRQGGATPLPQ
jgi:hypothetical protein